MIILLTPWWVVAGIKIVLAAISVLLIGVVLVQESKGGGLSGLAGGAAGESVLGARGNKELAKFTVFIATAFFLLCLVSGILGQGETSAIRNFEEDEPAKVGGTLEPGTPSEDAAGGTVPAENGGETGTDSGPGETGTGETGPGETGPGETGTGETGTGETGTGETGTGETGTGETGTGDNGGNTETSEDASSGDGG